MIIIRKISNPPNILLLLLFFGKEISKAMVTILSESIVMAQVFVMFSTCIRLFSNLGLVFEIYRNICGIRANFCLFCRLIFLIFRVSGNLFRDSYHKSGNSGTKSTLDLWKFKVDNQQLCKLSQKRFRKPRFRHL